jgi:hypothetical protein
VRLMCWKKCLSSNWFVNINSFNKPFRKRNRLENETCSKESQSASPVFKQF